MPFRLAAIVLLTTFDAIADPLDDFARDFWQWRATTQPVSGDDIPRLERPEHFVPRWSSDTISDRLSRLGVFEDRLKAIAPGAREVDFRLMSSALARVRFELEIEKSWKRNPGFYIDQKLGLYFDALLQPPTFAERRSRVIVERLASIPMTLEHGKQNLTEMAFPFAKLAVDRLANAKQKLKASAAALGPLLAPGSLVRFQQEVERA